MTKYDLNIEFDHKAYTDGDTEDFVNKEAKGHRKQHQRNSTHPENSDQLTIWLDTMSHWGGYKDRKLIMQPCAFNRSKINREANQQMN